MDTPRTLQEIDYLLMVYDEARQGALRFSETDSDEDLRLLLAPGSSLGGARPKASVHDRDGHLSIAKFLHKDDEINTVRWEAVALTLAKKAGLPVTDWQLAPAYDLNPVPLDIRPKILTTTITEDDGTASLELAREVAGYFELKPAEAEAIIAEVQTAVSAWRQEAARLDLTSAEIERMASAFSE
ncbi:MAG: HipA domain-containing protein [Limnobacter sp.]|nr:HipA domain-containing protein [Limnobacter sp.]